MRPVFKFSRVQQVRQAIAEAIADERKYIHQLNGRPMHTLTRERAVGKVEGLQQVAGWLSDLPDTDALLAYAECMDIYQRWAAHIGPFDAPNVDAVFAKYGRDIERESHGQFLQRLLAVALQPYRG